MVEKALFTLLLIAGSTGHTEYIRSNCRVDQFNPLPNQCVCDIESREEYSSNRSGFAVFNCNQLACEEFSSTEKPAECTPGMRGVTCFVGQTEFTCPLQFPRVGSEVEAELLCNNSVSDINENGPMSRYYRNLSYPLCVPEGMSQPPFNGWHFTGQFVEGWN